MNVQSSRKIVIEKKGFKKNSFKTKKGLMETWDDSEPDASESDSEEEQANVTFMVTTSGSSFERESDSEEEAEGKARLEAEGKARLEAEEKARKEVEEKAVAEAVVAAAIEAKAKAKDNTKEATPIAAREDAKAKEVALTQGETSNSDLASLVLKTLEELQKEKNLVRAKLDQQDSLNSSIQTLLTQLLQRMPPHPNPYTP
ncbi:eukaryotic translation initiation factor 4 gamma-like [Lathyrus oleraceus]|uniref:eukaryotic translation initiation factor 4 gamma-like n=1 Tax=Pisum sativum TaxID=3888 RepID=UPI0021CF1E66|nr:eukaryotic translation initiation factor 4 gamma-like [Pisum sativum]